MIEAGFVLLVQSGLNSSPPMLGAHVPGGYMVQLPKDAIQKPGDVAWAYRSITSDGLYAISNELGYTEWRVQIDCHGYAAQDAIHLARAIEKLLRNGAGAPRTLSDPDATHLFGLYREPTCVDGFSDANRSYVRSLEYIVQYQQV